MRITCPNCGAQYEVPAEVIPQDGRDVQCSNCGVTWFQAHPERSLAEAEPLAEADAPEPESPEAALPEAEEVAPESEPDHAPVRRELDPSIADILKEEAAHEARLRRTPDPLESQPDLGLEAPDTAAAAALARDRAARMRQPAAPTISQPDPVPSRRDMLPDIEEINSTLRADHGRPTIRRPMERGEIPTRMPARSGFARGFAMVMLIAILIVLLYANAPTLAGKVPAADGFLNGLVAVVDKARFWLDAQVKGFTG